ncbi:MAG TPA: RNA polymerase sigma factor [Bacteroidales bacterium]
MTSIEFSSQLLSLESGLRKFAYRLSSKKDDADDLVQETFLRVLQKKDSFAENVNFKSWTFTIMKNIFVDSYRRNRKRETYEVERIDSFTIYQTDSISFENPDSTYSALEISQNIGLLEDKLRIPFSMYVDGYKYIEIADKLNLKLGTVKNRIFLTRKQLMVQLS